MKKENNCKTFLIKLAAISVAVVIVVNLLFNLIFAERLEKLDKILSINKSKTRNELKQKIGDEVNDLPVYIEGFGYFNFYEYQRLDIISTTLLNGVKLKQSMLIILEVS